MCEIIYGIHVIESVLYHNSARFIQVYLVKHIRNARLKFLLCLLKKHGVPIKFIDKKDLDNISNKGIHQGVVAKIEKRVSNTHMVYSILQKPNALFLILDGITDSRNFGACFRSADAAGVNAIISPKNRSARLNTIARKVSSGAAEIIPLIRVNNLVRMLLWLKRYNVWIIGTSPNADRCLYQTRKVHGALGLVVGSENKGMRRLTKKYCDEIVSIPMFGKVSSINVSVAVGVCLFEFIRRRKYVEHYNIK